MTDFGFGAALDFSDLDLDDFDALDISIMAVDEATAVPEGGASTGSWMCGGSKYSCSCSYWLT